MHQLLTQNIKDTLVHGHKDVPWSSTTKSEVTNGGTDPF